MSATQPIEERWEIPGLTEEKTDLSMLLVSDRISRWLEDQNKIIKSVSKKDRGVAKDDMRYSRSNVWTVEGNPGRWQIDMYQANSREYAHVIALSLIEMISARPTANVEWKGRKIGDVSVGYGVNIERTEWKGVVFVRGNIAVKVSSEPAGEGKYYDPQPIAAMIDSYLLDEPKIDDGITERTAIALTLKDATVDKEARSATAIVGKPYVVTISPVFKMNEKTTSATQPAGKTPASNSSVATASEMRIHATQAEIVKQSDGAVQVTFLAAGKQGMKCYYIDNDGKVVAYGTLDITVGKEPGNGRHLDIEPTTPAPATEAR
jgi:hypothetical protein